MVRRYVMFLAVLGALAGCATAAQRQADVVRTTLSQVQAQGKACTTAVNSDPIYQDLAQHFPLTDINQATLFQLSDQSYATPHEVELLSQRHDRLVPCRKLYVDGYGQVAPALATDYQELFAKADDILVSLTRRQLRRGEFVSSTKRTVLEATGKMRDTAQRLDAALEASHRQEMAQRAAAAQAFSNSMYQQQILNQNQQLINAANRPVTTNCMHLGMSTNFTSYYSAIGNLADRPPERI